MRQRDSAAVRLPALALLATVAVTFSGCLSGLTDDDGPVTYEAIRFDTSEGPFTLILYPEAAPETVALYKDYIMEDYYDGREFNRVIPGFVIQLVDRAGGATDDPRTVPLETHPDYHFSAGAVGIARNADPHSGGPEFFVMDFASGHLDGNYTVFGQVIDGLDVVHRAARVTAVEYSSVPDPVGVGLVPFDRMAVDPVSITGATLLEVELSAGQAAKYPLQSAPRVKDEDFAYTIDWEDDIRVGYPAHLTNYVRALDGQTAVPAPSEVKIRVDGGDPHAVGGSDFDGIYSWTWTPDDSGVHEVAFWWQGAARATFEVPVP